MAERGDLDEIKKYLSNMMEKMSGMSLHFCENQAADSIISHYAALAAKEEISFKAAIELPAEIPTDEIDLCLVLSNLLENAVEASIRTEKNRRKINLEVRLHHTHLILIQVENAFSGQIQEKNKSFNHRSVMEMESELNRSDVFLKKMGDQAASNIKMEFLQQRLYNSNGICLNYFAIGLLIIRVLFSLTHFQTFFNFTFPFFCVYYK